MDKTSIILRDNASNMVAAFGEDSGFTSAGCLIHTLQLVIKKEVIEFPAIKDALDKARKICTHANKSTIFCAELRKQQRLQIGNVETKILFFYIMEEFGHLSYLLSNLKSLQGETKKCSFKMW